MIREVLYRGKRILNDEWAFGDYGHNIYTSGTEIYNFNKDRADIYSVKPKTLGQYTGLTDKNGTKIFEGDIVQHLTFEDFDCQSIVKFGKYKQDGSFGEYCGTDCLGFYVEVNNFTCPDWCDNDPAAFPSYKKQQSILEVFKNCEVIGNIYDNPEVLK